MIDQSDWVLLLMLKNVTIFCSYKKQNVSHHKKKKKVPRTAQYGCNCRGAGGNGGCGEFDIIEAVIGGDYSDMLLTTVYDFKGTGAPGHDKYFLRPSVGEKEGGRERGRNREKQAYRDGKRGSCIVCASLLLSYSTVVLFHHCINNRLIIASSEVVVCMIGTAPYTASIRIICGIVTATVMT